MALSFRDEQHNLMVSVCVRIHNGFSSAAWQHHFGCSLLGRFHNGFLVLVQFAIVFAALRSGRHLCRNVFGNSTNLDQSVVGLLHSDHCIWFIVFHFDVKGIFFILGKLKKI